MHWVIIFQNGSLSVADLLSRHHSMCRCTKMGEWQWRRHEWAQYDENDDDDEHDK